MRRLILMLATLALVVAACSSEESSTPAGSTSTGPSASGSAAPATAADCAAANSASLVGTGLTVGTDNPAFPPYFQGGSDSEWEFNDPNNGKGLESAVAYEVAARMGFAETDVTWVVAPFNQTYKPGDKDYDFAIEQISYSEKRANAVAFSDSYYDVNQAVVVDKDTPIASATSIDDLKDYVLAAPIGTTSYDFIVDVIQPTSEPGAYNTLSDTVAALNAGQVDGIVVDLPTALYLADPFVQEAKNSTVVAQFPTAAAGEYFGMTFVTDNPLVECVNLALAEMTDDGTLAAIQEKWLSQKTNVGEVPVFG